jgi:HK97 family phage prohead protease
MPTHTPEFSSAADQEWNAPNLEDFDTDDLSEVDDHFVGSRTEFPPDTYGELAWPVVEPDGTLNLNALQNAAARISQTEGFSDEEKEEARSIVENLAEDNFPDAEFNAMSKEEEQDEEKSKKEEIAEILEEEGYSVEDIEELSSDEPEAPAVHTEDSNDDIREYFDQQKEENNGYEKRVYKNVELRQNTENAAVIEGFGAVTNTPEPIGQFKEVIRPGAFKKTIKEQDVRGLFNHDPNFVIGRTSANTLQLEERDDGLFFENTLPDTQFAQDLATLVQRGDITGASIGFKVVREQFSEDEEGDPLREIHELQLFDVGPVTFPAFPQTDIDARDKEGYSDHRSKIYRADQKVDFNFKQLVDVILRSENGTLCDQQDAELLESYLSHLKTLRKSVIISDEDEESSDSEDSFSDDYIQREIQKTQEQLMDI